MTQFTPMSLEMTAQYECEAPHYTRVERKAETKDRYAPLENGNFRCEKETAGDEVVISCVGDMLCEEKLYKSHVDKNGFYFHDILQFVRPVFAGSDLVIGNLETTVCESAPYTGEQYKIDGKYHCNAPIEFLQAIKQAGVDFLAMSNNHNCDSGVNGLLETMYHVDRMGFMRTGAFRPEETKRWTIAEVKGIKIAVLSYSTWFNRNESRFTELGREKILNVYAPEKAAADIKDAKAHGAEFILVYIHWGVDAEYKAKESENMRRMAQELADSGADYIVGSHTHSVQPHAIIKSRDGRTVPCIYSMGNFVTSEMSSVSRKTAILQLRLKKEDGWIALQSEKLIPCYIPDQAFGANYPILTPDCLPNSDEELKKYQAAHREVRSIMAHGLLGGYFMTNDNFCRILGVPNHLGYCRYTSVNFAMDARKGGVAIVSDITSNPMHVTEEDRCVELADIAMDKGAELLISRMQIKDYPCLIVDDVFDAYCKIIAAYRKRFSPKTISITGSIGKTTSTEMVYTVLSSKYNTHRNTGSANNVRYAGTVIQGLKSEHEVYVQETMEGPPYGAASTIARMVQPQAAIVTVVGTSHLETFGSQKRILESCLGVQDGMPEDGLLILNGDDPFQWGAECERKAVYYAIDNEEADYRAVNIRSEDMCMAFDVLHGDTVTPVKLYCFGKHNILDALAAFAAGKWAGMSDEETAAAIAKYRTSGIRQNLVKFAGYRLYLDCYNAAPESMRSAFDALSMIHRPEGGRYIAVLGDIKEVGEQEEAIHRQVGEMVLDSCIDVAICYGKSAALTAEVARAAGKIPVYHTEDADELVRLLREIVTTDDVTLFKGSHGMALEHIVDRTWGTWLHEEFERYDFKTRMVDDENLRYQVYTDHVTVVKKLSTKSELVIPSYVESLPVTSLGVSLFNQSTYTKKVTLPDTLVNIRYCAFYKAEKVQEIHIPSSVRIIDNSAFSTCKNLKTVTIDDGCTHLGYRAFGNCSNLETITIPASVKQIAREAFLNCKKLTIMGAAGSVAEQYARDHKIPFVCLVQENDEPNPAPSINPEVCCALIDAGSGEILFEQGGEEQALIASLSKIMLAYRMIKGIENDETPWKWDDLYTVGEEITFPSLGGTTINANSTIKGRVNNVAQYLMPGDKMSMEALLYGAMVVSGNDAAAAIAAAVDGTEENCLRLLDEQMHTAPFELSEKTIFKRIYGRECYSTPLDLAKMMKVILSDPSVAPKFWETAGAVVTDGKVSILSPDGTEEAVNRENTHPFIGGRYRDVLKTALGGDYRICGKTGTWIVDFDLVTVVEKEGRTLVSVVLRADNEKKRDESTYELLTWGFRDAKQDA